MNEMSFDQTHWGRQFLRKLNMYLQAIRWLELAT